MKCNYHQPGDIRDSGKEDWDKMEADKQLLTIPAQALQAVPQQLAVSVDPPGFVHQLVQLLVLVLSCKHGNIIVCFG